MRILLHGAHNINYGDNLFVNIFYRKILEKENVDICFLELKSLGINEVESNEIGYNKHGFDFLFADKFIYFSGGYFGEKNTSFKEAFFRYIRYCLISNLYKNKPIAIIGVGVGPISQKWLRKRIINIINMAEVVTVRDQESKDYIQSYGVEREIIVTTDTALVLDKNKLCNLDKTEVKKINAIAKSRKIIFYHISGFSIFENDKLIYALKEFLKKNTDYCVICGIDGFTTKKSLKKIQSVYKTIADNLGKNNVYFYNYVGTEQFTAFLNKVDFIITAKLHVGIVGSVLEKSVISFPKHQKIIRFFSQIGYSERCYDINCLSEFEILNIFEKYHLNSIKIPYQIKQKANHNIDILMDFISVNRE